MLLPFAERSIEGRESNEERADLPHRVFDSLPRTLHLSPISHGPRDAFGCGGRSVRAARGEPPNGSRLSCGDSLAGARVVAVSACPPGHNTPILLERSAPGSFKRLLGGVPFTMAGRGAVGVAVVLGPAL